MKTISEMVNEMRKLLPNENGDFALHGFDSMEDRWWAEFSNPVRSVMLGESSGIFQSGYHDTAENAVADLLEKVRRGEKSE